MNSIPFHRCKNGRVLAYPGILCAHDHSGEDVDIEIPILAILLNQAEAQRDEAFRLLKRLCEWDMMDTVDGPYWKEQIDLVMRGERGNF